MLRTIMLAASLGLLAGHAACLFSGRTPPSRASCAKLTGGTRPPRFERL